MDQQNPLQPPQPPGFPSATAAPPSFTGFLPPQPPSHPSYAEMITEAIVWDSRQGKEGGSSKRAISKYIDRVYTTSLLPPSHSSLLTHYLKELKHNGYLVMFKNSYQLASAAPAHTGSALTPHHPDLSNVNQSQQIQVQQQQEWGGGSVETGPKRRPGRPPKRRVESVRGQENGGGSGSGSGLGGGKKRGRPPKQHVIRPHSSEGEHQIMMEPADVPFAVQPETIIAMDGFEPEDQKRRPGRPPKLTPVVPIRKKAHSQVNGPDQAMQESMPVMSKRKPGRPPGRKNNVGGGEEGVVAVAVAVARRGRPKRRGFGPVSRPVGKRPRGRPPRSGGGGVVVVGKRRGRPPKASGGLPKVRRLSASGKPMGRPRKNDASPKLVSEQMENEELTKKLDLIQSKIRDAVDVLRPYIPNENAPLMALQQLQELAAPIVTPPQTAPPVMDAPTPINMNAPMPVNMNAPPPTGTTSESVSGAPYTSVPGSFSVHLPQMSVSAPFQVSSSFDNQQRMSWIPSNEEQS